MADILIERAHGLGLSEARRIAGQWAAQAREKFDMDTSYEEGDSADTLSFTRSGVSGTLAVTGAHFELQARLGFLLSAFKDRIETEIGKNLDELLAGQSDAPRDEGRPA